MPSTSSVQLDFPARPVPAAPAAPEPLGRDDIFAWQCLEPAILSERSPVISRSGGALHEEAARPGYMHSSESVAHSWRTGN